MSTVVFDVPVRCLVTVRRDATGEGVTFIQLRPTFERGRVADVSPDATSEDLTAARRVLEEETWRPLLELPADVVWET